MTFLVLLIRLFVLLPYNFQLWVGRRLGRIAYWLIKSRRRIGMINLRHCFPELSESALRKLCRENFEYIGAGLTEALAAWFMSERRVLKIPYRWEGQENYDAALATGKGIIALGGHFTTIEMIGRIFGKWVPTHFVYKPSRNPVVDQLVKEGRMQYAKGLLKHENMKAMVSALKQYKTVWFAPDQDFGRVRAEFVPFCGVPAATIVATNILAKLGHAVVMPMFMRREGKTYVLTTMPHWQGFPSGDDAEDCKHYNDVLTDYVRQHPEQYLWIHRRFKTVKEGQNIYAN